MWIAASLAERAGGGLEIVRTGPDGTTFRLSLDGL